MPYKNIEDRREQQRRWRKNNPELSRARAKQYRDADPEKRKAIVRKSLYNVSQEQFDKMLAKFNGLCWICKGAAATHIDHNHNCCDGSKSCGKCVRGLTCAGCNKMLGMAGDSVEILINAINYLKEHSRGTA